MVFVEPSFPRGGKIEKSSAKRSEKIIFGTRPEKKLKKTHKRNKSSKENASNANKKNVPEKFEALSAGLLNYKTIQEGMIIMGKIRQVDDISLKVSLPGRMSGKVSASCVSESYNKILKKFINSTENVINLKKLNKMYKIGQNVYCRVMQINSNGNRIDLNLSLKPNDCHYNLIHTNIRKGMIFNGAIEEIQEHGLIIETGIKNLRCFIPIENINVDEYGIGELVCIKVNTLTQTNEASTVIGKIIENDNNRKIKDSIEPNLDYLLPTTILKFTIKKLLKDGLEGTVMNDHFTCYVNEHQLSEPFSKLDDYKVNSTISAKILYVMPLTKLVYLSLNIDNDYEDEMEIKTGDIIENAVVHHIGTGGIIFLLNKKFKGIVSFTNIKINYIGNYDQDEMLNKYKMHSKHKLRIVLYDLMDSLFICNDNPKVLNEKFYSLNDCNPGDFVTVNVIAKYDEQQALFVKLGNCNGLIEKIFMSSYFFANVKIGEKIRCRILSSNLERNIVYLTNRVEYMDKNGSILLSLKKAKENKIFLGTIVKCCDRFLIVKFFNNIKGILYKSKITGLMSTELFAFNEGQTMPFIIIENESKLILDLVANSHKIGEICDAKILQNLQTGLEIELEEKNENVTYQSKGFMPIRLISEFPDLIDLKIKTFTPGQKIQAGCIVKTIFSFRDVDYFKLAPIRTFHKVQSGDIIRGFIKNVENDVIELLLPVRGFNKLLRIHLQMFLTLGDQNSNIVVYPDQIVYVKVLSKEKITNSLTVSARLTDVWNGDFQQTSELFSKYLEEITEIRKYLKSISHPIAELEIGKKISGRLGVKIKASNDWYVQIESGIQGLLKSNLIDKKNLKNFKEGYEVDLVILWIDYQNELFYCSNQKNDFDKIDIGTDIPTNYLNKSGIQAKILLKLDNVVICSLKKGKNPLVFMPTKLHYNDFEHLASKNLHENEFCRLTFIDSKWTIAILDEAKKFWIDIQTTKRRIRDEIDTIQRNKKLKKNKTSILLVKPKEIQHNDESSDLESDNDFDYLTDDLQNTEIEKRKNNAPIKNGNSSISSKNKTKNRTLEDNISETPSKKLKKSGKIEQSAQSSEEDEPEEQFENLASEEDEVEVHCELNDAEVHSEDNDDGENSEKEEASEAKIQEEYNKFVISAAKESKAAKFKFSTKPVLPGASNFWSDNLEISKVKEAESSSDEAEDDAEQPPKKKKRSTASERFQIEKNEEAKLREIEDKLANPNIQPENADQFDRLVLSDPNDSKNWINYMVFHLQSVEIDKARSIARKALKSISFREEQELLNIWIALINLELRYGNKESYNDVLKESLLCNDPYKVYSRVIEILTDDVNKKPELIEIISMVMKKFKDNPDVWKRLANSYFQIGLKDKAKQMLSKALTVLPQREHVNIIVAFANLNHKYDEIETAHTLLEQIITSYPKRVDVWCQYIDMLIKDEQIESARRTLERAVIQKIPIKKMRTLFKKYIEFEDNHGTEENVLKIKEMANNYIKKQVD